MAKKILVERETYVSKKTGKENFSYFIKGNVRGKDVKAAVIPPDIGGYTVLDIVFGDKMAAELKVVPFQMTNEASGEVITGNTYAVTSVGENGEVYECKIKPFRNSDKMLLQMMLK